MSQNSDFIPNSQYLTSQILEIVLDSIINFCAKFQYIGDETLCKPRLPNHVWYEPIIEDYKLRYTEDGNYLIVQYGSTLSGIEPIWYEKNHYEPLHQMVKGYRSKYIYNDTSGIESLEILKSDINSLDIKIAIGDAVVNYYKEIEAIRKIRSETDINDLIFVQEQLQKLDLHQKGFISDLDNEAKVYGKYLSCRWSLNWLNDVPLEKIQNPNISNEELLTSRIELPNNLVFNTEQEEAGNGFKQKRKTACEINIEDAEETMKAIGDNPTNKAAETYFKEKYKDGPSPSQLRKSWKFHKGGNPPELGDELRKKKAELRPKNKA